MSEAKGRKYKLFGKELQENLHRECGHVRIRPADDGCELCDIDWLLETGEVEDEDETRLLRAELVAEKFPEVVPS
jgi:hypothetical protein